MSYAIQLILQSHPALRSVVQRFCEPGHSSITDVDNLHSIIERKLPQEIMSPVSLVRHLKALTPCGSEMFVHFMKGENFMDFASIAKAGSYNRIKYAKAKELFYNKASLYKVAYAEEMGGPITTEEVIRRTHNRSGARPLAKPKNLTDNKGLSEPKRKDIEAMLCFMIGDDLSYMKNIVRA